MDKISSDAYAQFINIRHPHQNPRTSAFRRGVIEEELPAEPGRVRRGVNGEADGARVVENLVVISSLRGGMKRKINLCCVACSEIQTLVVTSARSSSCCLEMAAPAHRIPVDEQFVLTSN